MKVAVIINECRLTEALKTKLLSNELTEKYQIDYELFTPKPQDIKALIHSLNLNSYSALIIGGGDGTVRGIIEELVEYDGAIAVLPLGTFNVLATALNYPNDIDQLFAIIKNNKRKQIDLVQVNDKIVINHAWIGFYYKLLKLREKHKDILGKNRFLKLAFNAINLFRSLPVFHLEFKEKGKVERYDACLIYVGNNLSSSNILTFGERQSLSSGQLDVAILICQTHWQLFKGMLNLLFNKANNSSYIKRFPAEELIIHFRKETVNTVLDGELFNLVTPLQFKIYQKKLQVFTP